MRISTARRAAGAAGAAIAAIALAAPALAAAPPRTGTYVGTSTTNVAGQHLQPFSMSISHSSCAAPGSLSRRRAYCVTVNIQGGPQTTCGEGAITEQFFPVYEPIALTPARTLSHTYTLYSQADGQFYDRHVAGTTAAGTFQFSLAVSTTGTATGTMNYSVGGCNSGPLKIKAKRR
ncbi:MAG TPA: hypothetical protein VF380_05210 [Solirubrobacteraceae bacterium]